jgi:hypothetical protein
MVLMMAHQLQKNECVAIPILKNARQYIIHRAKKMITRWYTDQEHCKSLLGQTGCAPYKAADGSETSTLLMDECRILHQEQRILDALDESLSNNQFPAFRPCGADSRAGFGLQPGDPDAVYTLLAEGMFSRGGGFMRYR